MRTERHDAKFALGMAAVCWALAIVGAVLTIASSDYETLHTNLINTGIVAFSFFVAIVLTIVGFA